MALLVLCMSSIVVAWKILPSQTKRAHDMTVEEKEAVVMDLERLDTQYSDLSHAISDFRKTVLREIPIVSEVAPSDRLVWKTGQSLVFSSRFFSSDSGVQEIALLKLFLPPQVAVAPPVLPNSIGGIE